MKFTEQILHVDQVVQGSNEMVEQPWPLTCTEVTGQQMGGYVHSGFRAVIGCLLVFVSVHQTLCTLLYGDNRGVSTWSSICSDILTVLPDMTILFMSHKSLI